MRLLAIKGFCELYDAEKVIHAIFLLKVTERRKITFNRSLEDSFDIYEFSHYIARSRPFQKYMAEYSNIFRSNMKIERSHSKCLNISELLYTMPIKRTDTP